MRVGTARSSSTTHSGAKASRGQNFPPGGGRQDAWLTRPCCCGRRAQHVKELGAQTPQDLGSVLSSLRTRTDHRPGRRTGILFISATPRCSVSSLQMPLRTTMHPIDPSERVAKKGSSYGVLRCLRVEGGSRGGPRARRTDKFIVLTPNFSLKSSHLKMPQQSSPWRHQSVALALPRRHRAVPAELEASDRSHPYGASVPGMIICCAAVWRADTQDGG